MKEFLLSTIFFVFLQSCGRPVSPKYVGYEKFQIEKVGLKNNTLSTNVKLYNPNNYPLKLKSAAIDLYINNDFFGHSTLDSLIVLPGKDTTNVPLRMTASAKDILSNTLKVWLNPDVRVKIKGSAKAGRGNFFINVPIDYEGTQRIEL